MIQKSESIKELALSLSKAQGQFEHAKKDVENSFFKSKYADLASCIDAVKVQLSANGLAVTQITDFDESGKMYLLTILMHSSGEWISGRYPINPVKNDPQAYGSCIQYARRYSLCAITGIGADSDDDGNAASGKVDLSGYTTSLESAINLPDLQAKWSIIPKNLQSQLSGVKDKVKSKLSTQTQEAA